MSGKRKAGQVVAAKDNKRIARSVTELMLRTYYSFKEELSCPGEVSVGTHSFSIMMKLYFSDAPCSVTELAGFMHMQNPQLSKILNVLEEHAFINRDHPSDNRRRVDVSLSDAGREYVGRVFASMESIIEGAIADKDISDPSGVARAMDSVYTALYE